MYVFIIFHQNDSLHVWKQFSFLNDIKAAKLFFCMPTVSKACLERILSDSIKTTKPSVTLAMFLSLIKTISNTSDWVWIRLASNCAMPINRNITCASILIASVVQMFCRQITCSYTKNKIIIMCIIFIKSWSKHEYINTIHLRTVIGFGSVASSWRCRPNSKLFALDSGWAGTIGLVEILFSLEKKFLLPPFSPESKKVHISKLQMI